MREDENYFIFAGKKCTDFDAWVDGSGTYVSPSRDVDTISVPGRNGDLHEDNGRFANYTVTFDTCIPHAAADKLDAFRAWLLSVRGYHKLIEYCHPDYFWMAEYLDSLDPKMGTRNQFATFDTKFNVKPQRYLASGAQTRTITSGTKLYNPTRYEAKPLLRCYGTGTITVGSISATVSAINKSYTDIDSELQDCYEGTANRNSYVSLTGHTFPTLPAGQTGITFTGFTKVELTPRWWTI